MCALTIYALAEAQGAVCAETRQEDNRYSGLGVKEMVDKEEFEALQEEFEALQEENEVLKRLLTAYLSYEDKLYIRLKYGIDLGV